MKIYSINNSQIAQPKQATNKNATSLRNNSQINFGYLGDYRPYGEKSDSYGEDDDFFVIKFLTAPIWGPFYLGYKYYKNQREKNIQNLQEQANAIAQQLYANEKDPAKLLTNFIKASVISDPEKGLNKVIGKDQLKLDMHTEILSPMVAAINGDKDLVKTNSLPNSVIFFGPYGCGKTYFIRALGEHAQELGMNFVEPEIDPFDSEKNVKKIIDIFKEAEENFKKTGKYTFIYMDEMDSYALDRDISPANVREIGALLKLTENSSQRGALWLGSTNKINLVDKALMSRVTMTVPMEPMQDFELLDTLIYHLIKERGIESAKDLDYKKIIAKMGEFKNKYCPRDIDEIAEFALKNYKILNAEIKTENIISVMENKIHPKMSNADIEKFNKQLEFTRNEGYIKPGYTEFKFMKEDECE